MFNFKRAGLTPGVQGNEIKRLCNFHCHSHYSNAATTDSATKQQAYYDRNIELGHTTLFTTEHGTPWGYHEVYNLSEEKTKEDENGNTIITHQGMKYIYSVEAYFVIDNQVKDNKNCHIMLVAKNDEGRKEINKVTSNANMEGYYYKARTDLKHLLEMNPENVMITTACVGGLWKYDNFMPYQKEFDRLNEITEQIAMHKEVQELKNMNYAKMSEEQQAKLALAMLNGTGNVDKIEDSLLEELEELQAIKDIDRVWNARDIVEILHEHFGDSMYLEIQAHNTELQFSVNEQIKILSKELGIELIAGLDSHFIYPEDYIHRDALLFAKKMHYDDEDGWYCDYCSYETLVERFILQDSFTEEEIIRAIDNTLICETFANIRFSSDIKLPTIFPEKTQEERDQFMWEILMENLEEYKKELGDLYDEELYMKEIKGEFQDIKDTRMTDYFLLNYYVIKKGRDEYGGVLTYTGRGSGSSYLINLLLGFTTVDRLQANVPLLADRFMSKTRILETKSLPDIDFNTASYKPFAQAQDDLLGINNNFFMITFGKMGTKAAWRTYARVNDVDFDMASVVSKQITEFENTIKHLDGEDKDNCKPTDFIDEKYHEMFNSAMIYKGVIDNISPSPCSFLLLNEDIREEVGITKIKDVYVANITGKLADKMGYLKNDLLQVKTCDVTARVCERIGIEQPKSQELIDLTKGDTEIWEKVYHNGATCVINQCEQPTAIRKLGKYKPTNIDELCHWVAAIRPSFQSMYSKFEGRESFDYDIPEFDKILQGKHSVDSFLIYQEQIMETLEFAGIESSETYSIIKAISKKNSEIIDKAKDRFLEGFMKHANCNLESASKVWLIVENAAAYGFNAAHAYCVAIDSLYNAWLKVKYPYEFYETCLSLYAGELDEETSKDKDKIANLIGEMELHFGIKFGALKWGRDNTSFRANKKHNEINPSLMSVKFMNHDVAVKLYELSQEKEYDSFDELYRVLKDTSGINKRHIETLISIGYFEKFGKRKKLLKYVKMIEETFKKKTYNKAKTDPAILGIVKMFATKGHEEDKKTYRDLDTVALHKFVLNGIKDEELDEIEVLKLEYDLTGNILSEIPKGYSMGEVAAKSWTKPWMLFKSFKNGSERWLKVRVPASRIPRKGSVLLLSNVEKEVNKRYKRVDYVVDFEVIKEK